MNKLIENIKFKKIVIIYLVLLILVVSFIMLFLGNIYKDKIITFYNYHKITESFEENYNKNKFKKNIDNLSKSSKDIIDVVIINENNITYSTNNFYKNDLASINNTNNYYIDQNKNIYKLDTRDEFILDLFNIKNKDKNNYYNDFQINIDNDNLYTLNYLKNNNEKIIIVSKITSINNIEKYLKISFSILTLLFMMYWIIVTLMIYQNALKLKMNAFFWGIITLFTNVIGVVIYLIYIKNRVVCKKCHTSISINDKYCKSCGEKI